MAIKLPRGPEGESAILEDVEVVRLKLWFPNHETISEFHGWLSMQELYPYQGELSGGGWYIALWEPADAIRVREWMAEQAISEGR